MALDTNRLRGLQRFYRLLRDLETRLGGARRLAQCDGRVAWPRHGVYFFFEPGEARSDSGNGPRVVRVGTHALAERSRTSLWNRLSQHRGVASAGRGNHRGSIFRLLVGSALMERDPRLRVPTWGQGASATSEIRCGEHELEVLVSRTIGAMPFLWLAVEDAPGPASQRGLVERNAIALLSNFGRQALDPPSPNWLGRACTRERVRASGLWNNNHVEDAYDPAFLDELERLIGGSRPHVFGIHEEV